MSFFVRLVCLFLTSLSRMAVLISSIWRRWFWIDSKFYWQTKFRRSYQVFIFDNNTFPNHICFLFLEHLLGFQVISGSASLVRISESSCGLFSVCLQIHMWLELIQTHLDFTHSHPNVPELCSLENINWTIKAYCFSLYLWIFQITLIALWFMAHIQSFSWTCLKIRALLYDL